MNPLNRKMFRQPGMSRQPMGILASSPQLANVVRRRMNQPVQMAHGGYHPPRSPMGRVSTSRRPVPGSVRIPLIDLLPKSGFARPALDDFLASSGAARASAPGVVIPSGGLGSLTSPPVMSVRGSGPVRSGGVTGGPRPDVVERGQILAEIASQDRTSPPDFALQDDPSLAPSSVPVSSIPESGVGSLTEAQVDPMTRIGSSMSTEMLNRIRVARGLDPVPTTVSDSLVGAARAAIPEGTVTPAVLAANQAETERLMRNPALDSEEKAPFEDLPLGEFEGIGPQEDKSLPKQGDQLQDDPTLAPPKEAEPQKDPVTNLLPEISNILDDKEASTKKKADAVDEALNIKGTRKERTEQRYQMLKELLGEDKAKDIRTDAGYNLMMTGLMIAAGQSGDAMTNIATGLAKGLAGYGEAAGEAAKAATKEEKALKLMAAKEVGDEITAEKAAQIRARELAEDRDFRRDIAADKIQAQKEIAAMPGDTQRLLNSLAASSGRSAVDIYLSKSSKSGPGVPDRERFITDGLKTQVTRDGALDALAKQGINNPDDAQIAAYLGTLYDGIVSGASASQAQTTPSDGFGANVTVN